MLLEKRALTVEEIDAQTAVELPDRELMALVTVVLNNILNNNTVTIRIQDVHVTALCLTLLSSNSAVQCSS